MEQLKQPDPGDPDFTPPAIPTETVLPAPATAHTVSTDEPATDEPATAQPAPEGESALLDWAELDYVQS